MLKSCARDILVQQDGGNSSLSGKLQLGSIMQTRRVICQTQDSVFYRYDRVQIFFFLNCAPSPLAKSTLQFPFESTRLRHFCSMF